MKVIAKKSVAVFVSALMVCLLFAVAGCSSQSTTNNNASNSSKTDTMASRTIVDDAGRTVTIPGVGALSKVYYTGAPGEIMCFTLAPELAGGTTMQYSAAELAYLPEGTGSLPYLGTLSGGGQLNPEAIIAQGIQVIFSVTLDTPTDSDKTSADDLQSQTNIPVVVINGALDSLGNSYRELGTYLGKESQAEVLATYCEKTLAAVDAAVATIPSSKKLVVYYAEGSEGLQTEPVTSTHFSAFTRAGAIDAATEVGAGSSKGMSSVSLEQVIAWNPDVIIAWDDVIRGGADEMIRTSSNWSSIKAVQSGRVYTMPNVPFSWCDRPPSVNRILGIQWLASTLYPDYYKVDMLQVTKDFYATFYHATITDDQAKAILGNSYTG
jgi:iron complex transport system substrate-binding protein